LVAILVLAVGGIYAISDAVKAIEFAALSRGTAAALQERTDEYDLVGHEVHLQRLVSEVPTVLGADQGREPARAWLRDWEQLRQIAPRLRAASTGIKAKRLSRAAGDDHSDRHDAESYRLAALTALAAGIDSGEVVHAQRIRDHVRWTDEIDSFPHALYIDRWRAAREAVIQADGLTASTRYRYRTLDLTPQRGLVPIGMNPVTQLWEFYDLRSAWDPAGSTELKDIPIPQHEPGTGHISVTDSTGIVFVLLPAEKCWLGAQSLTPSAPLYDPQRGAIEPTPHEVEFGALFVARHELGIGQWERLTGLKSSQATPSPVSLLTSNTKRHPVNDSTDSALVWDLKRFSLRIPTSEEWERAARAGTVTRFYTGHSIETLRGHANLASDEMQERVPWSWGLDGYADLAPIDALLPNQNGLHHVFGNIAERTQSSPTLTLSAELWFRMHGTRATVYLGDCCSFGGTGSYEPSATRPRGLTLHTGLRLVRDVMP
jgi:hypothetical protein